MCVCVCVCVSVCGGLYIIWFCRSKYKCTKAKMKLHF